MFKYVLGGAAFAVLAGVPAISGAQVMGTATATPVIVERVDPSTTQKISAGISADSLTKLTKFVKDSQPLLIIDEKIVAAKAFSAIKASQFGAVELKTPSGGDLKYYGDKAKHGILNITTVAAAASNKKSQGNDGDTFTTQDGMTFRIRRRP